ncbi:MAG: hypothetical protein ACXWW5_04170, partial [Actinomycetota bacterium]
MKISTDPPTDPDLIEPTPARSTNGVLLVVVRAVIAVAITAAMFFLLVWSFNFLRDEGSNRFMVVGVAIGVGVGGVFLLYWGMNRVVDLFPARIREGTRPYVFVGPCLVILAVFLVYPVFNTFLISLKDAQSQDYVGLENYRFVFTDSDMLRAMR